MGMPYPCEAAVCMESSRVSFLVLVLGASAFTPAVTAGESGLHTFQPGAPDEPRWTMLKLDSPAGGELGVKIAWPELRCPMAWGFLFFQGTPEEATQFRGATFNFAHGRSGVEAYTTAPRGMTFSSMEYEGTQRCPSGAGFELRFPDLPAGPLYLLQFTAGTPFRATAVLSQNQGTFTILDASSGDRTYYVNSSGFQGGSHVGVHGPPICVRPDVTQDSLCDPCCHWVGDTLFGADVSLARRATLDFQQHPFFSFGASARFGVANMSVTTPLGDILGPTTALVDTGAGFVAGPPSIHTEQTGPRWAAGEYGFDIEMDARADPETGGPWRVYAVDFHFPEEEVEGRS